MFQSLILTLFPEMFPGPLGCSLAGKALDEGLWSLETMNIRDFAHDKHQSVDDRPYGGGTGMVLKPDVLAPALDAALAKLPGAVPIYMSPRGELLKQETAVELSRKKLVILCGRFEGVDERILQKYGMREVSVGDYILSGGEVAAMTLLDACVRLIPGVIGKESALAEESFSDGEKYAGLLEYPHYTRPPCWEGLSVPEVLLSGNHAEIEAWRQDMARKVTEERRADLWELYRSSRKSG